MRDDTIAADEFRASIFQDSGDPALAELRDQPGLTILDRSELFYREIQKLQPPLEFPVGEWWVHYSWRSCLVLLPGPDAFRRLRSDRNRNKITSSEQVSFRRLKIGVVGLSVGHAIAHTLALEGLCGQLRLADFDSIELSNLNRIPGSVFDVGVNKAVVAARRIAELDPYLDVQVFAEGLTEQSMAGFFDGLDLVVEECDSLDMKVRIRQEARRRRIPLLMETSDRGLFDVERYDQEPGRSLFHGLLGDIDPQTLHGLSTRDKAPHVMRILQAQELSARMAASMVEIDRTLSTWPQLGGDIQLGAAMVATAVRRFGRDEHLPSGRIRVDLEESFDLLDPVIQQRPSAAPIGEPTDLTAEIPLAPMDAVIHAVRLAPSGGNAQPWSVNATNSGITISLVRERSSAMDHEFRGSYVAIGAASYNARVAAASHRRRANVQWLPNGCGSDVVVAIDLQAGEEPDLALQYSAMVHRISNRSIGRRAALSDEAKGDLVTAAAAEGAAVHIVEDAGRLGELADVLAESDRLRYLTPLLHLQMTSELKWPGRERLDAGIDVRTLNLDDPDLAKLQVAQRPEVMANLAAWNGGSALGDDTRDRINASSALVVVVGPGHTALDYLRGGAAVERVWITAEQLGLGVQPVSPIFLYTLQDADFLAVSVPFHRQLSGLRDRFSMILNLAEGEVPMLVLRVSHDPAKAVRSERLPIDEVLTDLTA
ncbi:Rv1355c family protein [Nakamurella sp. PAMC28650]|uniref:Rv1355c family protein n=1 Tax=Nakamurella sp. PAMC28650 TaxID=2762325 RepID=UPI00164ED298|nr:Rv1355c family protein [Nakamurella sp. PAMC28650]QNK82065.1 Rv1355c family protein [Nakamurella sp. PAMC28650]